MAQATNRKTDDRRPAPERYSPDELVARARDLVGVQPEVARAALGGSTRALTVEEFRRACSAFLARAVRD